MRVRRSEACVAGTAILNLAEAHVAPMPAVKGVPDRSAESGYPYLRRTTRSWPGGFAWGVWRGAECCMGVAERVGWDCPMHEHGRERTG